MSNAIEQRSLRSRLLSGGSWTFAGRLVTVAAGFIVNALIARMISAEDVGAYFLLISVISVGTLVASLGLQVAVVRLVAQAMAQNLSGMARATIVTVLRIGSVSAVIAAVAIGFGGDIIASHIFNVSQMADMIWYAVTLVLILVPLGLLAESFRGFHYFGLAALFSNNTLTNVLMVLMLSVVMLVTTGNDLQQVLTISIVARVVSILLAGWIMRQRLIALEAPEYVSAKSVLDAGLPLMMSGVAIFVLTQADLWIVGMFTTAQDVAVYGAAIRLSQLTYMPLLIGNTMLAPFIAEMYSQGKIEKLEAVIRSASTVSTFFAGFMLLIFIVAGDFVLDMAFGEYYRNAYLLLVIISAGQFVNVWCGSSMIVLINTGHQKSVMYISLLFGGAMVIGSILMIKPFGVLGVAITMGLITAAQAIFTLFLVKGKTDMWTYAGIKYIKFIWGKIRI